MKRLAIVPVALAAALAGGAVQIVQDQCGPFTDVTPGFCPFVLELYYLGITVGTSATTFSPDDPLTRGQAAVFVAKGLNQSLARSSRRAALGQWWTAAPPYGIGLGVTTVGSHPVGVSSDGADLWVANQGDGTVSRVRGSDGKRLETWTGAFTPTEVLVAMGRIFLSNGNNFGAIYMIDPRQPPGPVTTVAEDLGFNPAGIAFDGSRIWTANIGSVSIVTPGTTLPWSVTTVTTGFATLVGALYDGANIWVTDYESGTLLKLDSSGAVIQSVVVGTGPGYPVFDGANIWVPNFFDGSVSVVRSSTGVVLTTLTGLDPGPSSAAFDGQRVLVTSYNGSSVSVWKSADFTPLGSFPTGSNSLPIGACSDGQSFWIALSNAGQLVRF
jgi:hypothetical protein